MDEKGNCTPAQAREIGFDRSGYAPAPVGVFTGTLVMKVYGDFCLRCYFITNTGEKSSSQHGRTDGRNGTVHHRGSLCVEVKWILRTCRFKQSGKIALKRTGSASQYGFTRKKRKEGRDERE